MARLNPNPAPSRTPSASFNETCALSALSKPSSSKEEDESQSRTRHEYTKPLLFPCATVSSRKTRKEGTSRYTADLRHETGVSTDMANGQMRVEAERSLVFPPDVVQEEEDDDNSSIEIPEAMCPTFIVQAGSIWSHAAISAWCNAVAAAAASEISMPPLPKNPTPNVTIRKTSSKRLMKF